MTYVAAGQETRAVWYPPAGTPIDPAIRGTTMVIAPGAGAGQAHPFMRSLAGALAAHGLEVVTFDFPYVAAGRRRPDRIDVLERAWIDTVAIVRARATGGRSRLFIGGKSMGGRVATHVAALTTAGLGLSGVVCFGYPLHPPSRAEARSVDHLARIDVPILILQGTRDAFGRPEEIGRAAAHAPRVEVLAVDGADHGFAVPRRPGVPAGSIHAGLAASVASWMVRTGVCP
jgi:predicted alpha/beta-hydrolase family hydrolase